MGCQHLDDTLRGLNLVVSRHDSSLASQRRQSWSAEGWYENGNADLLSMPKVGRESRHGLTPQTTTTVDGGVDSPRASIAGSCSMWIPAKNLSPTLGFTKPGHRDEPCGACTATACKAGVLEVWLGHNRSCVVVGGGPNVARQTTTPTFEANPERIEHQSSR